MGRRKYEIRRKRFSPELWARWLAEHNRCDEHQMRLAHGIAWLRGALDARCRLKRLGGG